MDTLNAEELKEMIIYAATEYFENCLSDFCVQHVSDSCIIFGGTNRLIWKPKSGFYPDASYCTTEFLRHYHEVEGR